MTRSGLLPFGANIRSDLPGYKSCVELEARMSFQDDRRYPTYRGNSWQFLSAGSMANSAATPYATSEKRRAICPAPVLFGT
jgi:hypothetical protein